MTDLDNQPRYHLYREGKTDAEIARASGALPNTIVVWRRRFGLPANPERNAARMYLYNLGWSDARISREQSCDRTTVRGWRLRNGLPPNFSTGQNETNRPAPSAAITLKRIRVAVGRALPADIADDACAELMLSVLEGKIEVCDIEAGARKMGNRMLDMYASKFSKTRSLDEALGSEEGFTLMDTLADERSEAWLEEMGATCSRSLH